MHEVTQCFLDRLRAVRWPDPEETVATYLKHWGKLEERILAEVNTKRWNATVYPYDGAAMLRNAAEHKGGEG